MRASRLAVVVAVCALLPGTSLADTEECERLVAEGVDHARKGEYEQAKECLEKAVLADPSSARAHLNLGVTLGDLGQWDDALKELEKVPRLESPPGANTAHAHAAIGNMYNAKNQPEKALPELQAALKVLPDFAHAWSYLSVTYSKLERWNEAMGAIDKALELDPTNQRFKDTRERIAEDVHLRSKGPRWEAEFPLPPLGGSATSEDLRKLVVSIPSRPELAVFDTTTTEEPKRLSIDFRPERLVWQNRFVYVTVGGASLLQAVDVETGKTQRTIKLPSALAEVACHRAKGLIYGTTASGEVYSIDPSSGKVTTTQARGTLVAVDPVGARFVYTAGPSAEKGADASRTALRKYAVSGADLKLVGTNPSAALRGSCLQVTPDGKRVFVVGEGAWKDPAGKGEATPNLVAAFDADAIDSPAGQLQAGERPFAIVFHPILDLGILASEKSLVRFQTKALVVTEAKWPVPLPAGSSIVWLAVCGGGARIVCCTSTDSKKEKEAGVLLAYVTLKLSDEERARLKNAGGGSATPPHEDDPEAARLAEQATQCLNRREYDKALDLFKQALAKDPASPKAQCYLGVCLYYMGRPDEGLPELEKVRKMEGASAVWRARAYMEIGQIYYEKYKAEKSVEYLKASIKLQADMYVAWKTLSLALTDLKRYEEALEAAEMALKLKPDDPDMPPRIDGLRRAAREAASAGPQFESSWALPSLGGWATTQDLKTLVASVPGRAELAVFDTTTKEEPRRVALEFAPGRLAFQGKLLYAAANGSAHVHAIDLETGKVQRTYKGQGEALVEIACHRSRGLVYAVGASGEVVSIDPSSGKVTATQGRGTLLAVDPKGTFVYTAGAGSDASQTALRKYAIQGANLKLVDAIENAAIRGACLQVTPDGKRLVVVGQGGWKDPKAADPSPNVVCIYETDSLKTVAGRIETAGPPVAIAFHPLLDLGALASEQAILQFSSKSFVTSQTWPFGLPSGGSSLLVAGRGTKLVCWKPGDPGKKVDGSLGLLSLKLTDDETAALEKALAPPGKGH